MSSSTDAIHIARDSLWISSFVFLSLFINFKSRDTAYQKYSHSSVLLWTSAAAIRLFLHVFTHVDSDLPKIIKLSTDSSFSFSPAFWSASIYSKHAFLWNTILIMPPLVFIGPCLATLLGFNSLGSNLRSTRRTSDMSCRVMLLLAVLTTALALGAAELAGSHNVLGMMKDRGTAALKILNLFAHSLEVVSIIPQIYVEEFEGASYSDGGIAFLDLHILCRITTRILDFAMFYVPNAHNLTLALLLRVKHLPHTLTLLLLMLTTMTCLRIIHKRKIVLVLMAVAFAAVCVLFESQAAQKTSKVDVWSLQGVKSVATSAISKQAQKTTVYFIIVSCMTLIVNGGGAAGTTVVVIAFVVQWRMRLLPSWLQKLLP